VACKALIICPDDEWSDKARLSLLKDDIHCETVLTGKEGQLLIYKKSFDFVFVDLDTENNSGIEVINYIRNAPPKIKVFAIVSSEERLKELCLDDSTLKRCGVLKLLVEPKLEEINQSIKDLGIIKIWQNLKPLESEEIPEASETTINDESFTRIKIEEFFQDTVAVMDFYLRIGSNKYIKIVHRGEKTPGQQIKKYCESGAEYLYFLTSDRSGFVSFQNEVTRQLLKKTNIDSPKILKSLKTTSDKYIDEIYTQGLQPQMIEEGKNICESMFSFTQKDKVLKELLGNLEEFNPAAYSHSFLVCFFSAIICKNLSWVGSKTKEALTLGGMFHDIGLLELPADLSKDLEAFSKEEMRTYQKHPVSGSQLLKGITGVNSSVEHIIMQHHEAINGSGYPLGITGNKIFPLAKIVSLADGYADYLVVKQISPMAALKEFLTIRDNLVKYDSELVRNLVNCFTFNDKK
jgi:HD-GYP domain-containing protein (c-di-GMP phosphodiesterase class II)